MINPPVAGTDGVIGAAIESLTCEVRMAGAFAIGAPAEFRRVTVTGVVLPRTSDVLPVTPTVVPMTFTVVVTSGEQQS